VEVLSAFVRGRTTHPPPRALRRFVWRQNFSARVSQPAGQTLPRPCPATSQPAKLSVDVQAAVTVLGRLPERSGMSRGDLSGAFLPGAQLREANLTGAQLRGANLSGAVLSKANLTGAQLRGANLAGAVLDGADLTGANLARVILYRADLTDAKLARAVFYRAELTEAQLARTDLARADLTGAELTGAVWSVSTRSRPPQRPPAPAPQLSAAPEISPHPPLAPPGRLTRAAESTHRFPHAREYAGAISTTVPDTVPTPHLRGTLFPLWRLPTSPGVDIAGLACLLCLTSSALLTALTAQLSTPPLEPRPATTTPTSVPTVPQPQPSPPAATQVPPTLHPLVPVPGAQYRVPAKPAPIIIFLPTQPAPRTTQRPRTSETQGITKTPRATHTPGTVKKQTPSPSLLGELPGAINQAWQTVRRVNTARSLLAPWASSAEIIGPGGGPWGPGAAPCHRNDWPPDGFPLALQP
jgi:hypothetical protein